MGTLNRSSSDYHEADTESAHRPSVPGRDNPAAARDVGDDAIAAAIATGDLATVQAAVHALAPGARANDAGLRGHLERSALSDEESLLVSLELQLGAPLPVEALDYTSAVASGTLTGPRLCALGDRAAVLRWIHLQFELATSDVASPIETYRAEFATRWPAHEGKSSDPESPVIRDSRGPRTERARAIFDELDAKPTSVLGANYASDSEFRSFVDSHNTPDVRNPGSSALTLLWQALNTYEHEERAEADPAIRGAVAQLSAEDRSVVENSSSWQTHIRTAAEEWGEAWQVLEREYSLPVARVDSTESTNAAPEGAGLSWVAENVELKVESLGRITTGGDYVYENGSIALGVGVAVPAESPVAAEFAFSMVAPNVNEAGTSLSLGPGNIVGVALNSPYTITESTGPEPFDDIDFTAAMLPPPNTTEPVALPTLHRTVRVNKQSSGVAYSDADRFSEAQAALQSMLVPGGSVRTILENSSAPRVSNLLASIDSGALRAEPMLHALDAAVDASTVSARARARELRFVPFLTVEGERYFPVTTVGTIGPGIVYTQVLGRNPEDIADTLLHEGVHALDHVVKNDAFSLYSSEFRAYWSQPPFVNLGSAIDPSMSGAGPKSPRARAIFMHLFTLYGYVRPYYEGDMEFRARVDDLVVPDGINMNLSPALANIFRYVTESTERGETRTLSSLLEPSVEPGLDYQTFYAALLPLHKELNDADRADLRANASWRTVIERLRFTPAPGEMATNQERQRSIMALLGIPLP